VFGALHSRRIPQLALKGGLDILFDTHCHLFDEQFHGDVEDVITRARMEGVGGLLVPAIAVEPSKRAIALAEQHDFIYAAVGIHPEAANGIADADYGVLVQLAQHEKVVAIGEIGLDYYWDAAPRDVQQNVLRRQIQLAKEVGLPVIIHNRDATQDTVQVLTEECNQQVHGVMHCFTGSYETALQCIKLGFFISFGGPVTFKNARSVKEVAAQIPDEWLLVETDAPYLTPHPFRGKRNEPARVRLVAEMLAELRGQPYEEIVQQTTQNARRLFVKVR